MFGKSFRRASKAVVETPVGVTGSKFELGARYFCILSYF
jgi:hypothetical protein